MSRSRSRGGLEVVAGSYRAARGGSRLAEHDPQETPAALAPVRDGYVPRAHRLWAAAFLLLEVIADDAPGDPDAAALALMRDLGPAVSSPDEVMRDAQPRCLYLALEHGDLVTHGRCSAARHARHCPARGLELIPGFPDAWRRCPRPVELACGDTATRYLTAPSPHTTNRPGAVTLRIPGTARPRPGWR